MVMGDGGWEGDAGRMRVRGVGVMGVVVRGLVDGRGG